MVREIPTPESNRHILKAKDILQRLVPELSQTELYFEGSGAQGVVLSTNGDKVYKVFCTVDPNSEHYQSYLKMAQSEADLLKRLAPYTPRVYRVIDDDYFVIEMERITRNKTRIDALPKYMKKWLLRKHINEITDALLKAGIIPFFDAEIAWDKEKK